MDYDELAELKRRLLRGYGSSAGRAEQVNCYQLICEEAADAIVALQTELKLQDGANDILQARVAELEAELTLDEQRVADMMDDVDRVSKKNERLRTLCDDNFDFLDAVVRAIGHRYISSTALSCDDDHTIRIHYASREAMDDASDAIYRIISKFNKDRGLIAPDSSEDMQRRADDLRAQVQSELATLRKMRKEQK